MKAEIDMTSPHDQEELQWWKDFYNRYDFYDDVNGDRWLVKDEVVKARKLEM